jgi:FMN phosphatase YigB (HAD superfamily)
VRVVAIRAVLFDLFDTLVDLHLDRLPEVSVRGRRTHSTYPFLHAALREHADVPFDRFAEVLAQVDAESHRVMFVERREVPTRERFATLATRLGVGAPELPDLLTRVHMDQVVGCVTVLEHHVPLLASLHQKARLGVCSNFTHAPAALRVIRDAGLAPYLDVVVISEDVGVRKPRPEIFEEALRQLGTSAAETVHVGDNLAADVGGAAAVDMRAVWITRRVNDLHAALQGYAGPWPAARVRDLAELPERLGELEQGRALGGRA